MAGYINKNLQPGEVVEYQGRVTRLVLLPTVFMVAVAIAALVLLHSASNSGFMNALRAVAIIALVLYALRLIFRYLRVRKAEYAVTDRRIIGKYGLIRREAVDILMTQISGVQLQQGFFARIFRYGALDVQAAGAHQELEYLKKPLKFRAAIYSRLENSRLLMGTAAYTLDVRVMPNGATPVAAAAAPASASVAPPPAPIAAAPAPAPIAAAPAPAPIAAAPAPAPIAAAPAPIAAAPAPAPASLPPAPAAIPPAMAPSPPFTPAATPAPVTAPGPAAAAPAPARRRVGIPNLPPNTPAHWAPDPFGKSALRYWDGSTWTEHVSQHQPVS